MSTAPVTLDSGYLGAEAFAATYLVTEGDRALFVETATGRAVPRMLEALAVRGLGPDAVDFVVITHVHLDHAGGASALMRACPRAVLLAHPKAARHAVDPSKLVKSAKAVYGEDRFAELYGEIEPIPEARVRVMADGERLRFGGRELTFLHTRGHANHHLVVHDSASNGVFTGDAFGIAYPALQAGGLFAFPSTSPTDFDPEAAKRSVDAIVATGAERVYLTHFGEQTAVAAIAAQLHASLDRHAAVLHAAVASGLEGEALLGLCRDGVGRIFADARAAVGLADDPLADRLLALDVDLNAQGVAVAAERLRAARG